MARLKRITPADISQHIIQRGNNKQVCFANEADMKATYNGLKTFQINAALVSMHGCS